MNIVCSCHITLHSLAGELDQDAIEGSIMTIIATIIKTPSFLQLFPTFCLQLGKQL